MKIEPRKPDLAIDEISVVCVGSFNPTIFQPAWFAREGILRAAEVEKATIDIIHQDVCAFSVDWLSVQVTRDRFIATTRAEAYKDHLLDLVCSVFAKLSHTPITQMGVNANVQVDFSSESDWHGFGHFLTPKTPWSGVVQKPGMQGINIRGARSDSEAGFVLVSVMPKIETKSKVIVRFNNHYEKSGDEGVASAFVALLSRQYQSDVANSLNLANKLIDNYIVCGEVDCGERE